MSVRVLKRNDHRLDVYAEPDDDARLARRPSIRDRMRFLHPDGRVWLGSVDLVEPFGNDGWHVRLRPVEEAES